MKRSMVFLVAALIAGSSFIAFSTLAIAGQWQAHQNNGFDVSFNITQTGTTLTGSASHSNGAVTGNVTDGSVINNWVDFTITWNNNTRGKYTGHIDPDGIIRDGFTFDLNNTASTAKWHSTATVNLGGGGGGSTPVISVEATPNQLQNGFNVRIGGAGFRAGESVVIQSRSLSQGVPSPWSFFTQTDANNLGGIASDTRSVLCAGGRFDFMGKGSVSGGSATVGFECPASSTTKSLQIKSTNKDLKSMQNKRINQDATFKELIRKE